ncbi:hypothetical protein PLICRDRAFT_92439 [Plicaturopsis crispa FD-325 SS-3]|nr:hypothetical protein PLICRDRAFT_92439 [Plicaturopsis crispa FD-325 SS-3]
MPAMLRSRSSSRPSEPIHHQTYHASTSRCLEENEEETFEDLLVPLQSFIASIPDNVLNPGWFGTYHDPARDCTLSVPPPTTLSDTMMHFLGPQSHRTGYGKRAARPTVTLVLPAQPCRAHQARYIRHFASAMVPRWYSMVTDTDCQWNGRNTSIYYCVRHGRPMHEPDGTGCGCMPHKTPFGPLDLEYARCA